MDKIEEYINTTDKKEYINNIEVFRFIFACSIVACHILGISTKNFLVYNNFKFIYNNSLHLWMSVELFFIISGFFFIYTYKPKQSWLDFFKAKIIRLWPVMIFTILLFAICSLFKIVHLYFMEDIFTLLFLNGLNISNHITEHSGLGNLHPLWFVSCLIYVSVFYRYIIKNYGLKNFYLLLIILIPLCMHIHSFNIQIFGSIGIIRAIYGIGIGCVLACFYINFKENFIKWKEVISTSLWKKIFISLAEIGIFAYLMFGLFLSDMDRLVEGDLILLFIFLFLLLLLNAGYLSKLFSQNWAVTLGKYSFAIFCTHSLWIDISQKYYFTKEIWNLVKTLPIKHPLIEIMYFGLPILIAILFGILVYYIFEKPVTKILKERYL